MTTHTFEPTAYYSSFGSHPPALHIASGDTVITSTVDANGVNARGEQVAGRPNPETGPFYVEGAEPGDTLQVHLDTLIPTARLATPIPSWRHTWSIQPTFLGCRNPGGRIGASSLPAARRSRSEPFPGLPDFSLPLSPMLGCLGVAPEGGQAISSSTSGPYGGNMDYRGCAAGTSFYFPVFVPGALLHLGDGHAVQGDGEVVGTGIEISFDVRFTVHLLKGKQIHWPRGENAGYIFTLGNARPLDQALQHATTEMLVWLEEDYGLDAYAASTLLGMCVQYDLGNIFDPAYTMVCKLAKHWLGGR